MATIRSARPEDAALLADIGFRAWDEAMIPVGESSSMAAHARQAFQSFTRTRWITISVAEHLGQAVGWAACEDLDNRITDFWLDPAHQGRGFSRILLDAIEQDILARGFDAVRLETHARNAQAVGFFAHCGYSVHSLTVVYNPKLDRDVETVGMVKRLVEPITDTYGPAGRFE